MKKDNTVLQIVIADNDTAFRRQIIERIKLCKGFDIKITAEAGNGVDVLELLLKQNADIVFADLDISGIDGIRLLQLIKHRHLSRCVVLMSEYADFECARKGIVYGAFDYLLKPVKTEELQELFERAAEVICAEASGYTGDYYQENEIVECINKHDSRISELAEGFIRHYRAEDVSAMQLGTRTIPALQRITENLLAELKWLKDIIPPFEHIRKQIFEAEGTEQVILAVKGYLMMLYDKVNDYYPKGKSEMSGKMIRYFLSNPYGNHALTDIADVMFASCSYVSHCFKTDVGISFVEYCNHYKIDSAKMLLVHSDLNIREIADRLCYADYKYMGRVFKNTVGLTPSEYRNQFLGRKRA